MHKVPLLRYKTIDICLRNRNRKWTLEDLISEVSVVLHRQGYIIASVSKRTIQQDIQDMRGILYNAPIIVKEKKYYTYSDKYFSIETIKNNVKTWSNGVVNELTGDYIQSSYPIMSLEMGTIITDGKKKYEVTGMHNHQNGSAMRLTIYVKPI